MESRKRTKMVGKWSFVLLLVSVVGDVNAQLQQIDKLRMSDKSMTRFELIKGINGLDKVLLRNNAGSSAEVYLYGGQVTSWKNEKAEELLFVSKEATFQLPKPIRGGIPICFPQFSGHGSLESDGFARNKVWSIDPEILSHRTNSSRAYVDLILKPTEEDLKLWPHSFEFRLRVTLGRGGGLLLTSRIKNTNADGKPFNFTFAYHTYFSVSDISKVSVQGLAKLDYLDSLQKNKRSSDQKNAININSEVDKTYLRTPTKLAILDHEKKRTIIIRKIGLPDAVVWNPWVKKAKDLADLGDNEYKHMLCVEAAAVEKPITLKPGEEWRGRQKLFAHSVLRGSSGSPETPLEE